MWCWEKAFILLSIVITLCHASTGHSKRHRHRDGLHDEPFGLSGSIDQDIDSHLDVLDQVNSITSSDEQSVIQIFHEAVEKYLALLQESLFTSIRRKNAKLRYYLLRERAIGEVDMKELVKEWGLALVQGCKDRVESVMKRILEVIGERWQYGRKNVWKHNRFVSGQRPNQKDEDRREGGSGGGRLGRLRDLREDREQFFF